mgnify:CR=1 FL=1
MNITDIISARAIALNRTEVASNAIPFLGASLFPNRKKLGLDLKWIKVHKGLNAVLAPSNFDAIPILRTREGFAMEHTEMPFFRESMHVKEKDMMEIARVQEADSPYIMDILNDIYDDTNRLIEAAEISAEAMRMQLLAGTSGVPKITIGTKDNTLYTYNYDPDSTYVANNYTALSGSSTWDNSSTATPLDDIRTAVNKLRNKGYNPRFVLMTTTTFNYLVSSTQIKNAIIAQSGITIDYVGDEVVRDIFERRTGLTILIYDKQYVNYAGATTNFYPDDQITIISDGPCGMTYWGTTPEERTLMSDPTVDVALYDGRIACAVKTEAGPPVKVLTTVSQICLPSYEGMDGTYIIKVK